MLSGFKNKLKSYSLQLTARGNMRTRAVLIVDDDRIIREQLDKELKRNFFRTFQAADGKGALKTFALEKIDILLLDVRLPDMDGLELLEKVKEKKSDCQIIVITGFGTREIAFQFLKRGAVDYIEKPVKIDELSTALGRAQEKLAEEEELSWRLLVIDDDEEITRLLKKFLEKEGYEVFGAVNGKEGLNIIENNKIDVVIIDIKMKDMDGIEVLQKAKRLYQDIEGIMISGYNDQELAIRALRAGAIDYIIKPVDLDELLFSVRRAIERINLNRNRLYRNREQKITSEIISRMDEDLGKRIEERPKELNNVQVQLFQTSKLATLGEMSAGLAHEMNQPLGGISLVAKNFRKLIERERLSKEEIESGVEDIEASVKRMSKIIQHIRIFARQDALEFVKVDVNETINSSLSLLGEQLRLHNIFVVQELNPDLPQITGEPYQLEQVWINLISNARDAVNMKRAKLKDKPKFKGQTIISSNLCKFESGKFVEIRVKDNGIGMSGEEKEKMFEPFFTTKEVGKAIGLGLAISYGIIKSHEGKIEVESKKGVGTTVRVILPVG